MCGGYTIRLDPSRILHLKAFMPKNAWRPLYNARPGEQLPLVTIEQPKKITMGWWNFIPHWMKDPRGRGVINARAESLLEKPYFKASFQKFRCIIPADGFFEWQKIGSAKQPYFFHRKDDKPFTFAGLYDLLPNKKQIGFTIITTTPNSKVKSIHNRMPVILDDAQEEEWLSPKANPNDLMLFLDPYPSEQMDLFPITSKVNSARNKTADILTRANLL